MQTKQRRLRVKMQKLTFGYEGATAKSGGQGRILRAVNSTPVRGIQQDILHFIPLLCTQVNFLTDSMPSSNMSSPDEENLIAQ